MEKKQFATIFWTAEDISSMRPNLSEEEADQFLSHNAKHIENAMVEAGWQVIEDLLKEKENTIKD